MASNTKQTENQRKHKARTAGRKTKAQKAKKGSTKSAKDLFRVEKK